MQKLKELRGKANKLRIKAVKQAKRIATATVLTQFILVLAFYGLAQTNIFSYFSPEVITIQNVQAREEIKEKIEEPETVKETIERVAEENDFDNIDLLNRIAECESGFDRYAKNPKSSARGIFQILDMHELTEDERYDPEIATEWTIKEIRKNGTRPWNASKHCWNK